MSLRKFTKKAQRHPQAPQATDLFTHGFELHRVGELAKAKEIYEQVLVKSPRHFDALHLLGVIAARSGKPSLAVELIGKAIKINPGVAAPYSNLGAALKELKQFDDAVKNYNRAIDLDPQMAEAYSNKGNVLRELGRFDESLACYDHAIRLKPNYADAYTNRGTLLKELRRFEEAISSYDLAIQLRPELAQAYCNKGTVLTELKQFNEALVNYEHAIRLQPGYAEAHVNRGNLLRPLMRFAEALASYQRAIELRPDYEFLPGMVAYIRQKISDWSSYDEVLRQLEVQLDSGRPASQPFVISTLLDSPRLQRISAQMWVQAKYPVKDTLEPTAQIARGDRIRLGYYSADFHDHATCYLMAELFERHDKSRFELFAFSFGPDKSDAMRHRVARAFDKFIDVRFVSDADVARMSRELGIDIAIDLKGYTQDARPGIFAYRCAPVQVNYLGYPGTMGAPYIDYLVGDKVLIPQESRDHYSEKIVYLPNSYQVNDTKRQISDAVFTREALGLPRDGFVFCCFNNSFKITPHMFDGWMRILQAVQGSVLWLLEDNPDATRNLKREAEARGVSEERLVFGVRMPVPAHLARQRLADLFLDTLPCNAHTTASDALWAGLPVLTLIGNSFAGRVAASLLSAMALPELITQTQDEYEQRAVELATEPLLLQAVRDKIVQNRLSAPLYDTALFVRHLESAYTLMHERRLSGLAPDHLFVKP
jgi:predicted O-linked N-acetylglucosamine transferase (SPINDLY family)